MHLSAISGQMQGLHALITQNIRQTFGVFGGGTTDTTAMPTSTGLATPSLPDGLGSQLNTWA